MALPSIDRNNVYKDSAERIPTDVAYVAEIISAKITSNEWGSKLEVAIDIAEGDFKGYYKKRFDEDTSEDKKWKGVVRINIPTGDGSEQDGWAIKSYNTNLCNIEDSNPGYTWDGDEKKLKKKKVGLVFRNKEYEVNGRTGWYSEPFKFITVDDARAQKFRKPKDKALNNSTTSAPASNVPDFVNVEESAEDVPF